MKISRTPSWFLALAFALILAFAAVLLPRSAAAEAAFSDAEKVMIADYFKKNMDKAHAQDEDIDDDGDGADIGKAKGKDKGKNKAKGKDKAEGKGKSAGMPHGLAKRDGLPPGLKKHIAKQGTLPPGLAKRSLPADLESKLPAAPEGTERMVVDKDVVLMNKASGLLLDVVRSALGNK